MATLPPALVNRRTIGFVAPLLLAACGNATTPSSTPDDLSAPEPDSSYAGTVQGPDAFIALVVSGSNAAVYACDGDGNIAEYFWGPTEDDTAVTRQHQRRDRSR